MNYSITAVETKSIPTHNPNSFLTQETTIKAVLVQGTVDYAVYLGKGSDQWVAGNGNKLSFGEAQGWFPFIEEKDYRR